MIFHLGMSGKWRIDPEELGTHDHLVIETEEGRRLSLGRSAPLRLGRSGGDERGRGVAGLRRDGARAAGAGLHGRLRCWPRSTGGWRRSRRCCSISGSSRGSAISMCARRSTWRASRRPTRRGGSRGPGWSGWSRRFAQILAAAIEAGGSTLKDYARPDGELGYFSHQFRVYGREGEACPCGGTVQRRVDGGRSTFHCTRCQR